VERCVRKRASRHEDDKCLAVARPALHVRNLFHHAHMRICCWYLALAGEHIKLSVVGIVSFFNDHAYAYGYGAE